MAAPSTIQSSFDRMTSDNKQVGEITYGRYIFKGGRVFGFDGREIEKPFLTAGEAQAQQQSMQSTSQFSGTPSRGAGGMMSWFGGNETTATGPRIGGTSVNISGGSGGGGGGFSQIQNPLIREAARQMEFNQWMYGTPYDLSQQQKIQSYERALAESQAFQDFAKTRTPSYAVGDPVAAARVRGEWSAQKEGEQKAAQQAYMLSAGQIPNTQQFKERTGQEYRYTRGY